MAEHSEDNKESTIDLHSKSKSQVVRKSKSSKTRLSAQHILGLSKLKLGEKSEIQVVTMAISDRSIYHEIPMVYSQRFDRKGVAKMENTYRLEPDMIFDYVVGEKLVKRIVESYLNDEMRYNPLDAQDFVRKISVNIKRAAKGMNVPRYKYVSVATIGQKKFQSVYTVSKVLWEMEFDRYIKYVFESQYLYCVAILYACYYN